MSCPALYMILHVKSELLFDPLDCSRCCPALLIISTYSVLSKLRHSALKESLIKSSRRTPGSRTILISLDSGFHRSDECGVVQSFVNDQLSSRAVMPVKTGIQLRTSGFRPRIGVRGKLPARNDDAFMAVTYGTAR